MWRLKNKSTIHKVCIADMVQILTTNVGPADFTWQFSISLKQSSEVEWSSDAWSCTPHLISTTWISIKMCDSRNSHPYLLCIVDKRRSQWSSLGIRSCICFYNTFVALGIPCSSMSYVRWSYLKTIQLWGGARTCFNARQSNRRKVLTGKRRTEEYAIDTALLLGNVIQASIEDI